MGTQKQQSQDHRIVRAPYTTNSLQRTTPSIDELRSRFEQAKPIPPRQPTTNKKSITYENRKTGQHFTIPSEKSLPSNYTLPDGFTRVQISKDFVPTFKEREKSPRSFSDSEESYSDGYKRNRLTKEKLRLKDTSARLKETGEQLSDTEAKLKEYVSILETRKNKIEQLHTQLINRREVIREKEKQVYDLERGLKDRELDVNKRMQRHSKHD